MFGFQKTESWILFWSHRVIVNTTAISRVGVRAKEVPSAGSVNSARRGELVIGFPLES